MGSVGSTHPGGWRRLEVWLADTVGAGCFVPAAPALLGTTKTLLILAAAGHRLAAAKGQNGSHRVQAGSSSS